jgi:hypothetical protein
LDMRPTNIWFGTHWKISNIFSHFSDWQKNANFVKTIFEILSQELASIFVCGLYLSLAGHIMVTR